MQVEMYFDFMASSYARNGFLVNVVLRGNDDRHNTLLA